MFTKKILAAAITSQPSASGVADAIDFDGATDYLSRSSDLIGNADGKTFTFSAWVWAGATSGSAIYSSNRNDIVVDVAGTACGLSIFFRSTAGTNICVVQQAAAGAGAIPRNTYFHLLLSVDLTSTVNRHIYINDVSLTSATWSIYLNQDIDFTTPNHEIAGRVSLTKLGARLAHVFLDYTYRDLSIEANRRLFITADRKPAANQSALNPILYLPLNDPTQPGKNLGTGGDFTLNGVVARSGRGPSQFNAPYSDLNGTSQYLSRTTALSGAVAGKAFTLGFCFNYDTAQGTTFCIGTSDPFDRVLIRLNSSGGLNASAYNSTGSGVLGCSLPIGTFVLGRNYVVVMTIDLSDVAKRSIYVNGVAASVTYTTYTNDTIDFNSNRVYVSKSSFGTYYVNGRLGNVFFDTKYIDLSQPANLAKFVTGTGIDAKPADLGANGEKPFGTPPLIYLPMYGNNAGKNYGTGGDFTVNSGPFAGARGPNEFLGNKADFDGSTGYLSRTSALTGVSDGKTFSASFWVRVDALGSQDRVLFNITTGASLRLQFGFDSSSRLFISARNAANSTILTAVTTALSANTDYFVHIFVDLANSANRGVFINGVSATVTWSTYSNQDIPLSQTVISLGAAYDSVPSDYLDGKLSEFYFTTDYIDFSQEANRLKFRDAFGNPVDLRPQIQAGTLPNPAIYMRFDPANFGKNEGYGGDFTPVGTITDGGQL